MRSRERENAMNSDFRDKLSNAATVVEITLGMVILIACIVSGIGIDSVVDVMLLAIARQMIVEHTSPIENLIAVLSIGILFVIRKYLYISRLDRRRSKKEIEEDIRAEVLGVENRNEPKKPEPPEIGSLI